MSATSRDNLAILRHYWKLGFTATDAAQKIRETEGQDALQDRTAQKWYQRFSSGDTSLEEDQIDDTENELQAENVGLPDSKEGNPNAAKQAVDYNGDCRTLGLETANDLASSFERSVRPLPPRVVAPTGVAPVAVAPGLLTVGTSARELLNLHEVRVSFSRLSYLLLRAQHLTEGCDSAKLVAALPTLLDQPGDFPEELKQLYFTGAAFLLKASRQPQARHLYFTGGSGGIRRVNDTTIWDPTSQDSTTTTPKTTALSTLQQQMERPVSKSVKIVKYTPSQDIHVWLAAFEQRCEMERIEDPIEMKQHLVASLDLATAYPALLSMHLPRYAGYEEVRQRLIERFARHGGADEYRELLRRRQQGKNESAEEYADALRTLGERAYPRMHPEDRERELADQFLAGIRTTPDLRERLYWVRPNNLLAAIRELHRLEGAKELAQRSAQPPVRMLNGERDGDPTPDATAQALLALTDLLEKQQRLLDNLVQRDQQQKTSPPAKAMICYGCGQPGHRNAQCPLRQNQGNGETESAHGNALRRAQAPATWQTPNAHQKKRMSAAQTPMPSPTVAHHEAECGGFVDTSDDQKIHAREADPYVTGRLAGREVPFLLDSGSRKNFLGASTWANVRRRMPRCIISHAIPDCVTMYDGTQLPLACKVIIPVEFGDVVADTEFLVTVTDCENLLGINFMREHCQNLDFAQGMLKFNNGACIPVRYSRRELQSCRVYTSEKCTLPPRSSALLAVQLDVGHPENRGSPSIVELVKSRLHPSCNTLEAAPALMTMPEGRGYIEVVNTADCEVFLQSGIRVGVATPLRTADLMYLEETPEPEVRHLPRSPEESSTAWLEEVEINSELSEDQRQRVRDLLVECQAAFSKHLLDAGLTHLPELDTTREATARAARTKKVHTRNKEAETALAEDLEATAPAVLQHDDHRCSQRLETGLDTNPEATDTSALRSDAHADCRYLEIRPDKTSEATADVDLLDDVQDCGSRNLETPMDHDSEATEQAALLMTAHNANPDQQCKFNSPEFCAESSRRVDRGQTLATAARSTLCPPSRQTAAHRLCGKSSPPLRHRPVLEKTHPMTTMIEPTATAACDEACFTCCVSPYSQESPGLCSGGKCTAPAAEIPVKRATMRTSKRDQRSYADVVRQSPSERPNPDADKTESRDQLRATEAETEEIRNPQPCRAVLTDFLRMPMTRQQFVDAQRADRAISYVLNLVENKALKPEFDARLRLTKEQRNLLGYYDNLREDNGLLMIDLTDGQQPPKVVLPEALDAQVLQELHSSPLCGHLGQTKTLKRLRERFWRPGLARVTENFITTELAKERLHLHQQLRDEHYSNLPAAKKLQPGDLVFLNNPVLEPDEAAKFHRPRKALYEVVEPKGEVVYKIRRRVPNPRARRDELVVHRRNLLLVPDADYQLTSDPEVEASPIPVVVGRPVRDRRPPERLLISDPRAKTYVSRTARMRVHKLKPCSAEMHKRPLHVSSSSSSDAEQGRPSRSRRRPGTPVSPETMGIPRRPLETINRRLRAEGNGSARPTRQVDRRPHRRTPSPEPQRRNGRPLRTSAPRRSPSPVLESHAAQHPARGQRHSPEVIDLTRDSPSPDATARTLMVDRIAAALAYVQLEQQVMRGLADIRLQVRNSLPDIDGARPAARERVGSEHHGRPGGTDERGGDLDDARHPDAAPSPMSWTDDTQGAAACSSAVWTDLAASLRRTLPRAPPPSPERPAETLDTGTQTESPIPEYRATVIAAGANLISAVLVRAARQGGEIVDLGGPIWAELRQTTAEERSRLFAEAVGLAGPDLERPNRPYALHLAAVRVARFMGGGEEDLPMLLMTPPRQGLLTVGTSARELLNLHEVRVSFSRLSYLLLRAQHLTEGCDSAKLVAALPTLLDQPGDFPEELKQLYFTGAAFLLKASRQPQARHLGRPADAARRRRRPPIPLAPGDQRLPLKWCRSGGPVGLACSAVLLTDGGEEISSSGVPEVPGEQWDALGPANVGENRVWPERKPVELGVAVQDGPGAGGAAAEGPKGCLAVRVKNKFPAAKLPSAQLCRAGADGKHLALKNTGVEPRLLYEDQARKLLLCRAHQVDRRRHAVLGVDLQTPGSRWHHCRSDVAAARSSSSSSALTGFGSGSPVSMGSSSAKGPRLAGRQLAQCPGAASRLGRRSVSSRPARGVGPAGTSPPSLDELVRLGVPATSRLSWEILAVRTASAARWYRPRRLVLRAGRRSPPPSAARSALPARRAAGQGGLLWQSEQRLAPRPRPPPHPARPAHCHGRVGLVGADAQLPKADVDEAAVWMNASSRPLLGQQLKEPPTRVSITGPNEKARVPRRIRMNVQRRALQSLLPQEAINGTSHLLQLIGRQARVLSQDDNAPVASLPHQRRRPGGQWSFFRWAVHPPGCIGLPILGRGFRGLEALFRHRPRLGSFRCRGPLAPGTVDGGSSRGGAAFLSSWSSRCLLEAPLRVGSTGLAEASPMVAGGMAEESTAPAEAGGTVSSTSRFVTSTAGSLSRFPADKDVQRRNVEEGVEAIAFKGQDASKAAVSVSVKTVAHSSASRHDVIVDGWPGDRWNSFRASPKVSQSVFLAFRLHGSRLVELGVTHKVDRGCDAVLQINLQAMDSLVADHYHAVGESLSRSSSSFSVVGDPQTSMGVSASSAVRVAVESSADVSPAWTLPSPPLRASVLSLPVPSASSVRSMRVAPASCRSEPPRLESGLLAVGVEREKRGPLTMRTKVLGLVQRALDQAGPPGAPGGSAIAISGFSSANCLTGHRIGRLPRLLCRRSLGPSSGFGSFGILGFISFPLLATEDGQLSQTNMNCGLRRQALSPTRKRWVFCRSPSLAKTSLPSFLGQFSFGRSSRRLRLLSSELHQMKMQPSVLADLTTLTGRPARSWSMSAASMVRQALSSSSAVRSCSSPKTMTAGWSLTFEAYTPSPSPLVAALVAGASGFSGGPGCACGHVTGRAGGKPICPGWGGAGARVTGRSCRGPGFSGVKEADDAIAESGKDAASVSARFKVETGSEKRPTSSAQPPQQAGPSGASTGSGAKNSAKSKKKVAFANGTSAEGGRGGRAAADTRELLVDDAEEFEDPAAAQQQQQSGSPEETISMKDDGYIALVLKVLASICDGQHFGLQNYLREQPDNIKSFNIVAEEVSQFINVAYSNINADTIDLLIQLFSTVNEFCAGNQENRSTVYDNKIIDYINFILRTADFDNCEPEQVVELRQTIANLVISLIEENSAEAIVIAREVKDTLDKKALYRVMTECYEAQQSSKKSTGFNRLEEDKELREAVYSVGFSFYTILARLYDIDPTIAKEELQITELQQKAFKFFKKNSMTIEILKNDNLQKIHFRVKNKNVLREELKEKLKWNVDRTSPSTKVRDFMDWTKAILKDIQYQKKVLSNPFTILLTRFWLIWNHCATLTAVILNILMLIGIESSDTPTTLKPHPWIPALEVNETARWKDDYPNLHLWMDSFSLLLMVLSFIILLAFFVANHPQLPNVRGLFERLRRMRQKKTEDEEEFSDTDSDGDKLSVSLFSIPTLYYIIFFFSALAGTFYRPYFFAFHLLNIVNNNQLLQGVIQAVTMNGLSLIWVSVLGIAIMYLFSVIAFAQFRHAFPGPNNLMFCRDLHQCFISVLRFGLIGDLFDNLVPEDAAGEKRSFDSFLPVAIFHIAFFILITTVGLNIIFGIIVDTFSELRNMKWTAEVDMRDNCFICSRNSYDFEHHGMGFDYHVRQEHNMWAYIFFFIHLEDTARNDYTSLDLHVYKLLAEEKYDFFPLNRALCLSAKDEDSTDSKIDELLHYVKNLVSHQKKEEAERKRWVELNRQRKWQRRVMGGAGVPGHNRESSCEDEDNFLSIPRWHPILNQEAKDRQATSSRNSEDDYKLTMSKEDLIQGPAAPVVEEAAAEQHLGFLDEYDEDGEPRRRPEQPAAPRNEDQP
uniref:CCHC-type domain-containing protein n=2 Tax=Macrostomum lignano TaxID=282301 RepID=A0A1I8JJ97_9PLAT